MNSWLCAVHLKGNWNSACKTCLTVSWSRTVHSNADGRAGFNSTETTLITFGEEGAAQPAGDQREWAGSGSFTAARPVQAAIYPVML